MSRAKTSQSNIAGPITAMIGSRRWHLSWSKSRSLSFFTSGGAPPALAARAATSRIPIVFATGIDPVAAGLVASISRPSGNVTGVSFLAPEVVSKQMSILRELIPSATVVGLPVNPDNSDIEVVLRDAQEASRTLGFQVVLTQVRSADDFESAFASFVRQRANAVLLGFDR